jgi:CMP-N-acetylneuraminic acid synthetase
MTFNLGVTLARGGSKSIPKKNITNVNGIPLLAYTIQEAQKSSMIDAYIINTDCEEIAAVANRFGAEVQFGRPPNLSLDTAQSGHTLKYVVERFENEKNVEVTIVTELMATNPLKKVFDIDECIKILNKNNADSTIAMGRLYDHHPSRIKYLDNELTICDFYPEIPESRRQDLKPDAYIRAGSIYVMTRKQISSGRRYGEGKSLGYVLPDERFINIDDQRDLFIAERIMTEL